MAKDSTVCRSSPGVGCIYLAHTYQLIRRSKPFEIELFPKFRPQRAKVGLIGKSLARGKWFQEPLASYLRSKF
jgi:hypothetical protein